MASEGCICPATADGVHRTAQGEIVVATGSSGIIGALRLASDYLVGTSLVADGGMGLYPAFRGNG